MTHFLMPTATEDKKTFERVSQQERLIIQTSELVWIEAKKQGKTLEKLAKAIGKTRGYLSQLLAGDRNMTLRTLSDLAYSLDMEITVALKQKGGWSSSKDIQNIVNDMAKPKKKIYDISDHPRWQPLKKVS